MLIVSNPSSPPDSRSALVRVAFWLVVLLGVSSASQALEPLAPEVAAKMNVLDQYTGTWDVTLKTRVPKPSTLTYTETFAWMPERRFMRGETSHKSDGTQDLMMTTYDQAGGGYPFWFFSSSGLWIYLAPGTWDASTRTMVWKNPPNAAVNYVSRCQFPDGRTRHCASIVKDWKGNVLLDQEASAVRRP